MYLSTARIEAVGFHDLSSDLDSAPLTHVLLYAEHNSKLKFLHRRVTLTHTETPDQRCNEAGGNIAYNRIVWPVIGITNVARPINHTHLQLDPCKESIHLIAKRFSRKTTYCFLRDFQCIAYAYAQSLSHRWDRLRIVWHNNYAIVNHF